MRQSRESDIGGYDWTTIILWASLVFAGWSMIFAAGYLDDGSFVSFYDLNKTYGRQMLWIVIGVVIVGIIQLIESNLYRAFAPLFYIFAAFLLIAVLFTKPVNGATSWFDLGGFRFQPSEFAKVATCIMLATFLSLPNSRMQELKVKMIAMGIILCPLLLVLLQ